MYTEYYFDCDIEKENESEKRSNALPQKEERIRNVAGICRVAIVSAVLVLDLQYGVNLFTTLATLFTLPLVFGLKD